MAFYQYRTFFVKLIKMKIRKSKLQMQKSVNSNSWIKTTFVLISILNKLVTIERCFFLDIQLLGIPAWLSDIQKVLQHNQLVLHHSIYYCVVPVIHQQLLRRSGHFRIPRKSLWHCGREGSPRVPVGL